MCNETKPNLKMVGEDGNGFAIIGRAMKAGRLAGWNEEKQNQVRDEMMNGNYDHLLLVTMEHFNVC